MKNIPYQYNDHVFQIRKIRENFDASTIKESPHRHQFYEFLYIKSGSGKHEVDGIAYGLKEHTFHIISKGQVHQFLFAKDIDGYLIRFQEGILPAVLSTKEGFYYNILYQISQHQDVFVEEKDRSLVDILLTRMLEEYKSQQQTILDLSLIQHLLYPLLILMHRYINSKIENINYHQNQYVQFTNLLEEFYKQNQDLGFYAQKVGVTKRQLSQICMENTGRTAKQLLNERTITEAQRFLKYTALSLKEISDKLGYKNVAYFCRRFKKMTGKTPTEFKNK